MLKSPCENCRNKGCMRTCAQWTDWFRIAWTSATALLRVGK